MSPNEQLVQYIENEAYNGRSVEDIIADIRKAGWNDEQIQTAVTTLNQEHDIMQQLDIDPLHKRIRQGKLKLLLFVSLIAFVVILGASLVAESAKRPEFMTFSDPNFSLLLPDNWDSGVDYEPAAAQLTFYSPEFEGAGEFEKAASMTMFVDAKDDVFGGQLRRGGSNARIISDESGGAGSLKYRTIEFVSDNFDGSSGRVHGLYVLVNKGQITMSATITSADEHWGRHADVAEKILESIVPKCNRKALTAELSVDGTIFLCGN